jgi:hypothetical protein
LKSKLFSSDTTNTFEGNGNKATESYSTNKKENFNPSAKRCCCSLYEMDHILKNMQKMWNIID